MFAIRASAIAALLLLGLYHVIRLAVAQCNGTVCDWYIAPSIIVPLLVLTMVAVTGILAIQAARRRIQERNGGIWLTALVTTTAIGVAGPVVVLPFLRNSPDALVVIGTIFYLLAPITALAHSYMRE